MSLIVQKYGGKCLATTDSMKSVAERVAASHQAGNSMIVVVSAMGQTTDELMDLAYKVSQKPNRRELDMLLTTGERISMALLSMALQDLGRKAISYTGSQAGVFTDDSHSGARIIDIRPIRIDESLKRGEIVVLAGFQGVSPVTKEVTTLGRGGSDTTAVAMAAHFKAEKCEILKDVEGICSVDPKLASSATTYSKLSYDTVGEMCFWGAKVLHYRSIELARKESVTLFVGSATKLNTGTWIIPEDQMLEKPKVVGVNSHKEVVHLRVPGRDTAEAYKAIAEVAKTHSLPMPQLLASVFENDHCRVMMTGEQESLKSFLKAAPKGFETLMTPLSSVTVTGYGCTGADWIAQWLGKLSTHGIAVEKVVTSPLSVSIFIQPEFREQALTLSHEFTLQ